MSYTPNDIKHQLKLPKLVSFGDFLKRYIYMNPGFDEPFETVDIKEYQSIIVHCFRENGTPMSFTGTSSKPSVLAKNWLTQSSVSRNVVLLLGFGLAMILFAGLREQLSLNDVPKSFKGVPIALVTAGILAMAFMGFSGLV